MIMIQFRIGHRHTHGATINPSVQQHFAICKIRSSSGFRFSSAGNKRILCNFKLALLFQLIFAFYFITAFGPKRMHDGRMDFGHGKFRMTLEEDRLSSLPDELIYKILSHLSLQEAIETSVLSTSWRSIWKSMPYLNFVSLVKIDSPHDFFTLVYNVLSHRNNQAQLSSVDLYCDGKVSHEFVKRFLEYMVTHNIQQLNLTWLLEDEAEFPLSLYSCRSLQHLNLHNIAFRASYSATPTWDLPNLTTLHLSNITVSNNCSDLFSKSCPNLKNLKLNGFTMRKTNVFKICHPQLSNLTLEWTYCGVEVVNVVAPQPKNLTIKHGYRKHLICAHGLTSLVIEGLEHLQQIATEGFPSLEKMDIHFFTLRLEHDAPEMARFLQQFHNVKLLILNFQILKTLSSSTGLMSNQLSPFANFKIVKFLPSDRFGTVFLEAGATTSLLDTFDKTLIFPMVSREEIKVMSDIISAQLNIARNQCWVQKRKALITDTNHLEEVNAPKDKCKTKMNGNGKAQVKKKMVKSAFEKRWHFEEMMAQIKRGKREGLLEKFSMYDIRDLIPLLQKIDGLVTELSGSNGSVIQATFSIVCEEAAVVTNGILDCMKIPYNKKP
ncbi:hypothetical protein LXL04_026023 [Taraxacum kok-saghyz]